MSMSGVGRALTVPMYVGLDRPFVPPNWVQDARALSF
jgi:hypothetical protein